MIYDWHNESNHKIPETHERNFSPDSVSGIRV